MNCFPRLARFLEMVEISNTTLSKQHIFSDKKPEFQKGAMAWSTVRSRARATRRFASVCGRQTSSAKGPIVNTPGFAGHMVHVTTTQFFQRAGKAARDKT